MKIQIVRRAAVAAAIAAVFATGSSDRVEALTATANLAVNATVNNTCTISTAPLAFGTYDPVVTHAAAVLDGTGTVTIACTKGAVTTIELGLGANASGAQRRMLIAGEFLNYEIYSDSGRTAVWGTGATDDLNVVAAPSKAPRSFTAYGRVAMGQDVTAGTYVDTVLATVNF
jgi:spore coat protein U domain-containing protein, fimbrial subunit CupE1/2/3/6